MARRARKTPAGPRKRRANPEEVLHMAVARFLNRALCDAIWWHTPNGGARSKAEAGRLKEMGVKPGIPDIFVWDEGGHLFGIELKPPLPRLKSGAESKRKQTSDAQDEMLGALSMRGAKVCICRSVEEVETFLRAWGVQLRATVLAR